MTLKVLFYNVDEFLGELRAQRTIHSISEGHVVRVTATSQRLNEIETAITVVAGTLISGCLFELRDRIARLMPGDNVKEKVEPALGYIRDAVRGMGLSACDGMYAPGDAR